MNKKLSKIAAALAAVLALTGCGKENVQVPVMQVSMLSNASQNGEKFAGMVVSENSVQIPKENEKTIKSVKVKVGDAVKENDVLFSYDSDELSLTMDRQNLELEKMKGTASEKQNQLAEVEKKIKGLSGDERLEWELKRLELKADLTQAEYDQQAKEKEISHTKQLLDNVNVLSPINGTVRKIDETNNNAYMVIQQSDAYRVRGTLNELSMNAGIREGTEVTVVSRLDPNQTWKGSVAGIEYNTNVGNSDSSESSGAVMGGMMGDAGNGAPGSTSYPFYVTLEDTTGLLLGQHVYIQIGSGEPVNPDRIVLPSLYLVDISEDLTTAYVLKSSGSGKIDRHQVSLGEYDPNTDCYEIAGGLSADDYIADPSGSQNAQDGLADPHGEEDYQGTPDQMPEMGGEISDGGMENGLNGEPEDSFAQDGIAENDGETMPDMQTNPNGMEG